MFFFRVPCTQLWKLLLTLFIKVEISICMFINSVMQNFQFVDIPFTKYKIIYAGIWYVYFFRNKTENNIFKGIKVALWKHYFYKAKPCRNFD